MKFTNLTKLLIFTIAVLFTWSSGALAGGGPAGENCWLTDNPSGGALALKATIAVVFTPSEDPDGVGNVDAVIRIQRGSDQTFYRINIAHNLIGDSDEIISCKLLNTCIYPQFSEDPITIENKRRVNELVNNITGYFFGALPDTMEFLITSRSVSDTDYNGNDEERNIPNTGRAASIADLTLYAVEKLP